MKDAIAGAEFLKGLGYVDPQAIGITGTSYGGILTMCAVTFAPGLFQAAVPMSGLQRLAGVAPPVGTAAHQTPGA